MMIGDTIVRIDTVFVEKSSDYLTRKEVLDIYEKVHGHYYDHLELFLVLLGLGIAVFGFIIPRMINKNIEKSEKRIENEINRFDRRINETIEKIQSDIKAYKKSLDDKVTSSDKKLDAMKVEIKSFKDDIDNRIDERIAENIKDVVIKLNNNTKLNFKNYENYQNTHMNTIEGIVFAINNQYKDSLNIYLRAVLNAVKSKQGKSISSIENNIKNSENEYQKVNINEINPEKNYSLFDYFKIIEENLGDDESLRIVYNKFRKTLLNIINKEVKKYEELDYNDRKM